MTRQRSDRGRPPAASTHDVFLSYNSRDSEAARQLHALLAGRGLKVWFDQNEILPGDLWLEKLDQGLLGSPSVVFLLGAHGWGPWAREEMLAAFNRPELRLIPVFLPGAPKAPDLPLFLRSRRWVDLRSGISGEPLELLVRSLLASAPAVLSPRLAAYRDWAVERFRGLDLLGLGHGDVQLPFSEVYVPLRLEARRAFPLASGGKEDYRLRDLEQRDLGLDEVIPRMVAAGCRGAVLFGHAGSGKTTALRKVHHLCLADGAAGSLGLPEGTLPVLVRLRALAAADVDLPPGELLGRYLAAESEGRVEAAAGTELWERGRLLLLLDGLDEVADEMLRAALCRRVEHWLEEASGRAVRAWISCRFTGWSRRVELGAGFLPLAVQPFDAGQCRRLVERWFAAAPAAGFPARDSEAARDRLLAALEGADYARQRLKELVGSPLLLTLLCVVVLRGRDMPKQRAAFYHECLQVLLGSWRSHRGYQSAGGQPGPPPLGVDEALTVLGALAWAIHSKPDRRDLGRQELLYHLELALAPRRQAESADGVAEWLLREVGVLADFGAGYGFQHWGIQEYLVALHLAAHGEALLGELSARFGEEGWREAPLLLVGMPRHRLFAPFLERLLAGRALFDHTDLVRDCLDEAAEPDLAPFLALLAEGVEAARQAAVLRLLLGRSDPDLLEKARALRDRTTAHEEVRLLAAEVVSRGERPRGELLAVLYTAGEAAAALGLVGALERQGVRARGLAAGSEGWEEILPAAWALLIQVRPGGPPPWAERDAEFGLRRFAGRGKPVVRVGLPGRGRPPAEPEGLAWTARVELSEQWPTAWPILQSALLPALPRSAPPSGPRKAAPAAGAGWVEETTGIRFLAIPGGRFQMGGTVHDDEKPPHWVRVSPFWLGETPVTNRQYGVYLQAAGPEEPPRWRDRRFSNPEQPVVGVSWEDAVAFCRWLSDVTGRRIDLPSEAQWEFAARGEKGREYPWGNQKPEKTRACFDFGIERGQPAPVGSFPAGKGPFRTLDQAGNVWEWCLDAWNAEAYQQREQGEEPVDPVVLVDHAERRALRGGSWRSSAGDLRSAVRDWYPAGHRGGDFGFRVAAAPAST